jgi:O-antigen/teichoic acid export membrane protein
MGFDNVLTPQAAHAFATGGILELRRILLRTAALLVISVGGLCALIVATGDRMAVLAFGSVGHGTGLILTALAISALINSIGVVAGNGLWAINKPRANFQADLSCMAATLITASFLIFPFGALGAALAILSGMVVSTVVRMIMLAREFDACDLKASNAPDAALSS